MKNKLLLILAGMALSIIPKTVFAQYNKLLVGDNNNGRIIMSNIDGSDTVSVNTGRLFRSYYDADIDTVNKKIYLAWYYGIYSMNYDGSDFDTLVDYSPGGYSEGLAVDMTNGYIYWGSAQEGKIYRSDLNGKNIKEVAGGLGYLTDVDYDPVAGELYFSAYIISATKGLYKMDTSGTTVIPMLKGADVRHIGLDTKNQRVYYTMNNTVNRMNYDGTQDTVILNVSSLGLFVDQQNSLLYLSAIGASSGDNVMVCGLNGENPVTLYPPGYFQVPYAPIPFYYCKTSYSIQTVEACGSFTSPSGKVWTSSDTYQDTIHTRTGCDSVITYNLTINDVDVTVSTERTTMTANAINATYQWLNCDSSMKPVQGATERNYTALWNGEYAVVVSQNGCSDTSVCINITAVNISELTGNSHISIYPNPGKGIVTVNLGGLDNVNIRAYNSLGALVFSEENIQTPIYQLELNQKPGLYILAIEVAGETKHFRLVKE